MASVNLLQEALANASLERDPKSPIRTSQRGRSRLHYDSSLESDDDAPAGIETPMTMPGTPVSQSRSTSPTRTPSRMAERRRQRELEAATSHDPLRRLPNEVASRILLQLRVADLLVCGRVCKRWRKSQTLNYCWYALLQRHTFLDAPPAKPVWTQRDSKQDWAARYKSVHRRDDLETSNAADAEWERARSEGYRTPREEREARWTEENASSEGAAVDKNAARAYYKSLKNAKGAKGGGTGRTTRDRTEVWED